MPTSSERASHLPLIWFHFVCSVFVFCIHFWWQTMQINEWEKTKRSEKSVHQLNLIMPSSTALASMATVLFCRLFLWRNWRWPVHFVEREKEIKTNCLKENLIVEIANAFSRIVFLSSNSKEWEICLRCKRWTLPWVSKTFATFLFSPRRRCSTSTSINRRQLCKFSFFSEERQHNPNHNICHFICIFRNSFSAICTFNIDQYRRRQWRRWRRRTKWRNDGKSLHLIKYV